MAQAEGLDNTSAGWWSLAQTLVWIIWRITKLPQDAERIVNSPEMNLKSEWALNELKKEVYKELYKVKILGAARSWPTDKFRILQDGCYVDLLDLFRPLLGAPSDIQLAILREFVEGIRWQDVICNSAWLQQAVPASAPTTAASVPAANTESLAAKPEAALPPPEPAILTDTASAKPPEPNSDRRSAVAESEPPQGAAEIQPKESPPPNKPDAPAPSRSDALERDTEKIPAISASTSKAETASSPNTETTPTAGRRLGQCRPGRS